MLYIPKNSTDASAARLAGLIFLTAQKAFYTFMTLLIDLLLPHKERFTEQNAGAVSTVVYELARHITKKDKQELTIFGSAVDDPKPDVTFVGLTPKHFFWQSRNFAMARAYLAMLDKTGRRPDIVEVHGRPQVALALAKARPDLNITLYLHNDPRDMKGAKAVEERMILARKLAGIICITDYVKGCFEEGLGPISDYDVKISVNHLGVSLQRRSTEKRKKRIFMAGRMVPEKGFLEACKGALPVLDAHRDWELWLAGGKNFHEGALTPYEKQLHALLAPLGERAKMLGHQPLEKVRHYQQTSEICLVPSLWQEPGGLTVLEALSAGAALITTNRGGIPEFATGRAIIVSPDSPLAFSDAIDLLIRSPSEREKWQKQANEAFPFTSLAMSQRAAQFRQALLA